MIWIEHAREPVWGTDSKHIYICVVEDEYAAFITCTPEGYRAQLAMEVGPRGESPRAYYYTHDTLEAAKEWCVVELWKRRLT